MRDSLAALFVFEGACGGKCTHTGARTECELACMISYRRAGSLRWGEHEIDSAQARLSRHFGTVAENEPDFSVQNRRPTPQSN